MSLKALLGIQNIPNFFLKLENKKKMAVKKIFFLKNVLWTFWECSLLAAYLFQNVQRKFKSNISIMFAKW